MAKSLIDKIPRYNIADEDCPNDWIAIFYLNLGDEKRLKDLFRAAETDLDWIIIEDRDSAILKIEIPPL